MVVEKEVEASQSYRFSSDSGSRKSLKNVEVFNVEKLEDFEGSGEGKPVNSGNPRHNSVKNIHEYQPKDLKNGKAPLVSNFDEKNKPGMGEEAEND